MKRILSTLFLLTMVMAATAATLKICGTSIDLSKNTTGGTGGVSSGSYNYNYQEKELTLNNVTITRTVDNNSNNDYGIYSTVSDLVIVFKGNCNISTKASAIFLEGYTTFINKGTVNITSSSNRAVYIKGGDSGTALQIYGGTWNLTGNHGIEGNKNNDYLRLYDLDVSNPLKMNVKGTDGSIIDLKEILLPDGFTMTSTVGTPFNFNSTKHSVCKVNTSTIVTENIIIAQFTFALGGGFWTTWHNDSHYAQRSNIYGTVSYDKSTKTVTLDNVTVGSTNEGGGFNYFSPELDNMQLKLKGSNNIIYDGSYGILCRNKNFVITGDGYLDVGPININSDNGLNYELKIMSGAKVYITNSTDNKSAISGGGGYSVVISEATLKVNVKSSVVSIDAPVVLHNSVISSPVNIVRLDDFTPNSLFSVMDESRCSFYDLDRKTKHKGSLLIQPGTAYDLWVNGVQVNSLNRGNLNSALSSGSCSYTPSTKTLTLSNAMISYYNRGYEEFPAIYNKINGLIINHSGTSEIGGNNRGIRSEGNLTITGSGHLKVTGTGTAYGAININDYTLTVNNMELTATGGKYAIFGSSNSDKGTVSLNDSYLHLTCNSDIDYSSAVRVTSFEPNCIITYPVNGIFRYGVIREADGTTLAKKVEIEPKKGIVTTIDAVTPIEEVGETSIYTTSGTLVWQGAGQPQLPRGIYIMKKNGKVQKVQKN